MGDKHMKKIVAFGASNSRRSINRRFAAYAAAQVADAEVLLLDLNEYEMPIYSIDREQENGIPQQAYDFKAAIKSADAIIISLSEHNGSYTAAFKNIADWVSRIEGSTWAGKPVLLMATSPGPRGGQGVLASATKAFPHQGAQVVGSFSLPSFRQNFDATNGITNEALAAAFNSQIENLNKALYGTHTETSATRA